MEGFDVGIACLNGHAVNGSSTRRPQFNAKFCDECGAPCVDACYACSTKLRGRYWGGAIVTRAWAPAAFCFACGEPYPWTAARLDAARALALEADLLSVEEQQSLVATFDDLIRDTPRTPVAATRFKRLMTKAGTGTASGMKDILVEVVAEATKRSIWGP